MKAPNERNLSVDLIRTIAMLMVIGLHTQIGFFEHNPVLSRITYYSCVPAIPLFFMSSGYMLIGRENATYGYALRRIGRVLRFAAIFAGANYIYFRVICGYGPLAPMWCAKDFVKSLLGIGSMSILWFLFALCIVYAVYPVINRMRSNLQYYVTALVLVALVQSWYFSLNITGAGEKIHPQTLRVWNWIFYFMLGGLLRDFRFGKVPALILTVAAAALNLKASAYLVPHLNTIFCEYFYPGLVVITLSTGLFSLCLNIKVGKLKSAVEAMAPLFLPVYVLHSFAISATAPLREYIYPGAPLVYWVVVAALSIGISYAVMKIPFVNKIFRI